MSWTVDFQERNHMKDGQTISLKKSGTITLPEKVKWTNIAVAYVNQVKSQSKMAQHKHKKLSPDGSDKIEMHDGKVFMNGQEYTHEEFSKIMPGIKVPQGQKPPFETIRNNPYSLMR